MEAELARYAEGLRRVRGDDGNIENGSYQDGAIETTLLRSPDVNGNNGAVVVDDGSSLVSIEDYMTSFDGIAARNSLAFMTQGFKEIQEEISHFHCGNKNSISSTSSSDEEDKEEARQEILSQEEIEKRRVAWKRQQASLSANSLEVAHEETPLLV